MGDDADRVWPDGFRRLGGSASGFRTTELWALTIFVRQRIAARQCNAGTALRVSAFGRYSARGCTVASMQILPLAEAIDDKTHAMVRCERTRGTE
jgi:hypothetical protein